MKRLSIVIAITLCSGTALWVLAKADLNGLKDRVIPKLVAVRSVTKPVAVRPDGIYNVSLSHAQISPTDNNQIIVVMDAKGDLPGALTLKVARNGADSTITGGEWALVVAYTELLPNQPSEDG